jgi:YHS domain-containing protein
VRIYFCCAESRRRFENNPEPYIQKLKEQYIIKEPSSGEKADTSLSNQEQNKNRTDNAQISGASLEQVQPQVVDAISGKPINKNVYTDYRGVRIYFCCEESRRRFQNNPQKYIESLKEQYIVKESSSEGK